MEKLHNRLRSIDTFLSDIIEYLIDKFFIKHINALRLLLLKPM